VSSRRWFRALLRLLPFDFRADYGEELERVFREDWHDRARARGRIGAAGAWAALVGTLLAVGPREHAVQLWQDVRYAVRAIRRQPGFATVAILTLSLGIGANTAIFGLVHAVVLRPLPYERPGELVAVWNTWTGNQAGGLSDPEFLDYSENSRTVTMAAMASTSANVSGGTGDAERVPAAFMTVNGLDVLGMNVRLGREFGRDDERRGHEPVVLLSDRLWRRRFAANPAIVGSAVVIDGAAHRVASCRRISSRWISSRIHLWTWCCPWSSIARRRGTSEAATTCARSAGWRRASRGKPHRPRCRISSPL